MQRISDAVTAVVAEVRRRGGIARSEGLRRIGFGKHAIAAAVNGGLLERVRRVWVAVPEAEPDLVRAARSGVVLSCVTQAARLGLWVLDATSPHVGAPAHSGRVQIAGARVHRAQPLLLRHPDDLVDPIENVLAVVAVCQPFESALAIWESALRTPHVTAESMQRFALGSAARTILSAANPWSDSGLETLVLSRLRWLRIPIVPQAWIAGHRVDFLLGARLVLQIDGGHHVGRQRASDIAHDAELMLRGYHVIRIGYRQVVDEWPQVQAVIQRAVAQGLHLARG